MLDLDITKKRELSFEISSSGVDSKNLSGSVRLEIDGVEYGFPVRFESDSILTTIPALKNIVNRPIKEGEKIKAKLDLISDGFYLNPWSEEFTVKNDVMVEVKLIDKVKPVVKIKEKKVEKTKPIVQEKKIEKPKTKVSVVTEAHVYKLMEMNGVKTKNIQDILYKQASVQAGTDDNKQIFKALLNYFKGIKK